MTGKYALNCECYCYVQSFKYAWYTVTKLDS